MTLRRRADQGDSDAQKALGDYYSVEPADIPDVMQAVDWYDKAAIQGHAEAKEKLEDLARQHSEAQYRCAAMVSSSDSTWQARQRRRSNHDSSDERKEWNLGD
jgi:TPR repeat protein